MLTDHWGRHVSGRRDRSEGHAATGRAVWKALRSCCWFAVKVESFPTLLHLPAMCNFPQQPGG